MSQPDTAIKEILDDLAKWIYEATRVEAEWSNRPIVPEQWELRDDKFRNQFVDIIAEYMAMDKLPTPEEAHESWNQAYFKMGWKYGKVRDTEAKTHPDLVPFDELSQAERDKDAIFLAFVWLAKHTTQAIQQLIENEVTEALRIAKARLETANYRPLTQDSIDWAFLNKYEESSKKQS